MSDLSFEAQQLQQAFVLRMKASQPSFDLSRSKWADYRLWLPLASLVEEYGITSELLMSLCFDLARGPVQAWVIAGMSRNQALRKMCVHVQEKHNMTGQVTDILKWAMTRFAEVIAPDGLDSPTYVSALVESPISVQPWLRVLLGFKHPEVVRRYLPEALEYFEQRPDIVKACLELGFPPMILKPLSNDY